MGDLHSPTVILSGAANASGARRSGRAEPATDREHHSPQPLWWRHYRAADVVVSAQRWWRPANRCGDPVLGRFAATAHATAPGSSIPGPSMW